MTQVSVMRLEPGTVWLRIQRANHWATTPPMAILNFSQKGGEGQQTAQRHPSHDGQMRPAVMK